MSLTEGVFDHSKNRYRLDKQSAWPTEIFKCLCNVPRHVSRDQLAQTLNDFLGIAHLEDGVELSFAETEGREELVTRVRNAFKEDAPGTINPCLDPF